MSDLTPAIVIVAYNRPRSLSRLLGSLEKAYYPDLSIPLIISIDKADNNTDVLDIAKKFDWKHGAKEVRYQKVNLGLRKHVLQCGDLTDQYNAIIMLEDDLYVSPNFYDYTVQALNFVKDDNKIGGVSLYNHKLNVHNSKNFEPVHDGYDNWYFQFASSWGQAWSSEQWNNFKTWYITNPSLNHNERIPAYVRSWSEKSWLKYFIAYLIISDKFFLYPKIALTTNFSDAGTHVGKDSTVFQLPLLYQKKKEYYFSTLEKSYAVYDAFYENTLLAQLLELPKEMLSIDLYGYKNTPNDSEQNYFLTSKKMPYVVIKNFGCSLKPMDANIFEAIEGDDFFLYDLTQRSTSPKKTGDNYRKLIYNYKQLSLNDCLLLTKTLVREKILRVFHRIVR